MTRLPAEWEPHERTVMCWPARRELWGAQFGAAEHAFAEVARTVAAFEPVTMLAPADFAERAATMCGDGVEVMEMPLDDSWFRDSGPIYVFDADGARVATDWTFNSWGQKFLPYADDAAVAQRFAAASRHRVNTIDMVLEGGSITSDGAGTIVTTTQCLLHPNRNPSMSRVDIERHLRDELGGEQIIWLPFGLDLDDDTDGHVDNVAAFADPANLVMQGCADTDEADWLRMDMNRRSATDALDARARPIDVTVVPILPFTEVDGDRVAVPYLNYYVGNGFVVVPTCGHAADDDMLELIGEQYAEREVVGLDVGAVLAHGGGGIHCITQQVPAAREAVPAVHS